jgi:hypothetical protein
MREQGMFDAARLVFVDETAANTKMLRLSGRCRRGERLIGRVPQGHWKWRGPCRQSFASRPRLAVKSAVGIRSCSHACRSCAFALAFRPDAVEHLQQQGAQQLLRRDRRRPSLA